MLDYPTDDDDELTDPGDAEEERHSQHSVKDKVKASANTGLPSKASMLV